jgi:hypothetical protein
MDEKTAELRDLFVEATGTDTVTERQAEGRGTLVDRDPEAAVRAVVAAMRERYPFTSDADGETLAAVVRAVHAGVDDAAIAADLGLDETAVRDARFDLHLVRESDRETPDGVAWADLRRLAAEGASLGAVADDLGVDADAVALPYRAAMADDASRRVNDRFRGEFAAVLDDADLSDRLTAMDDGLREATEDIETDVSF